MTMSIRAARVRCFSLGAIGLAALSLTGCSWVRGDYYDVKCPVVETVGELGSVSRFQGDSANFAAMAYRAELTNVQSTCDIDSSGVSIHVALTVLAEIGPGAAARDADFPYFVAIMGPNDKVLTKRVMSNPLSFPPAQQHAGASDTIEERIPLKNPRTAESYRVFVGFQLSPEELAFNRSHGTEASESIR